jgi:hypothetical protein
MLFLNYDKNKQHYHEQSKNYFEQYFRIIFDEQDTLSEFNEQKEQNYEEQNYEEESKTHFKYGKIAIYELTIGNLKIENFYSVFSIRKDSSKKLHESLQTISSLQNSCKHESFKRSCDRILPNFTKFCEYAIKYHRYLIGLPYPKISHPESSYVESINWVRL